MKRSITPETSRRRLLIIAAATILLSGAFDVALCAQPPAGGEVADPTPKSEKEPRFVFHAPDGFVWVPNRRIWFHKALRVSVSPSHAVGMKLSAVADDFSAERMREADLELLSKETQEIDGRPTLIVKGNRLKSKYPQKTCTVAYATKTGCAQLTVIYPASVGAKLEETLVQAVVKSRYVEPE